MSKGSLNKNGSLTPSKMEADRDYIGIIDIMET